MFGWWRGRPRRAGGISGACGNRADRSGRDSRAIPGRVTARLADIADRPSHHFRARCGETNASSHSRMCATPRTSIPGSAARSGTIGVPRCAAIVAGGGGDRDPRNRHQQSRQRLSDQPRPAEGSRPACPCRTRIVRWCNRRRAIPDAARARRSKMEQKRRVRRPSVGGDSAIHISAQPSQKVLARDAASHYLTTTPAGHH